MKKLPIGIQNFREIVNSDYVYIDKTKYIYDLLNSVKCYFLSRPRRFGKSLLLDTIAEVFSGDKELFRGLWIHDSDYSFDMHPVLRLDMSNLSSETPQILERELTASLSSRANTEGFELTFVSPSSALRNLIERLRRKYNRSVVILIDEYDKPILDHLLDTATAEANRATLRSFYGVLKSMDPYLKLTFITGVTKFTKTSMFSELNNLLDITLFEEYAGICGIPVEELDNSLHEHVEALASIDYFKQYKSIRDEILAWYDGYSWDGVNRVLNPFGLFTFFLHRKFSSFWYASGSPTFLISLLKQKPASFLALSNVEMRERVLDTFDINKIGAASLLFQTGYLTVKKILPGMGPPVYLLDIPNLEVREALYMNIIAEFTEHGEEFAETAYLRIRESLRTGDLQNILEILRGLFASIPYALHVDAEAYYHSLFFALMSVLGFHVDAEVSTSTGRIDAVLELDDKVYIMEFKYQHCDPGADADVKRGIFDEALDRGMKQIRDRGYAAKYSGSGKTIYQTAFAFLGRDNVEMRTEII